MGSAMQVGLWAPLTIPIATPKDPRAPGTLAGDAGLHSQRVADQDIVNVFAPNIERLPRTPIEWGDPLP